MNCNKILGCSGGWYALSEGKHRGEVIGYRTGKYMAYKTI